MSALIGAYQRATNRLLPYRALHTDLVAHEEYYTFNDSSATDPEDDLSQWTQGSNALTTDGSATHTYNGEASWVLRADSTPPIDDTNVYVESAATNLHTDIPCTFRVIARAGVLDDVWIRIYDPNQALSDAWFHLTAGSTGDPETHIGEVGQTSVNVIEARITYPIPDLTNLGPGSEGDSAHFMLIEMELPAAASRTMRIQVVDGDADTDLDAQSVVYIARAEIRQGKVSRWTCRRTGRTFSQATPANQPYARPMGVPKFNGRRVLRFSGSQFLVSDDAATEWDFLHSGVGCSIYAAYMPTTASSLRLMSTSDGASEGIRIRTDIDADTRTGVDIWNGSDTVVTSVYSSNGTTPIDALYIAGYRCEDGHADGDATLDVGGAQYVGNASTWGSSGTPTTTLHIGAENGGSEFDGYIADIAIYEARLTDDEHARVVEEFEALNASSQSIPGCICWVRAGEEFDSTAPTTWGDQSGAGNNLTGALGAGPSEVASSPSFRGSPVVVYDEAERSVADGVAADLADLTADHAVIKTCQLTALTAGIDVIWAFQNSADVNEYELFGVSGGQWLYERSADGAVVDSALVGTADLKPHTHSFILSSGQRSAYVDGTALFSGVASTPGVMATDRFTVANNRSATLGAAVAVSELAIYSQAPTTYQRQLVERAQRRRMLGGRPLLGGYSVGAITPVSAPADLLSVVQSLGGVALLDFRDAAGYTLSGSDLTGVTNLVSSVAWSVAGTPQWGATMIDSGPGIDLNGSDQWLHSTEAAVVAAFAGSASRTVIYRAEHDSADSNEGVVGAGLPGASSNNRRVFGLNNTGSGCYRDLSTNNAGSTTSVLSPSGSSSTSPRTHRWRSDSSTTRLHLDGTGADLGGGAGVAVAHAPGTLTPDTVVIGAIATSTGVVNLMNGRLSVVAIFPSVLSDGDCALVEAFLP